VDQSATVYRQTSNTNTIDYLIKDLFSSFFFVYVIYSFVTTILTFISVLTSSTILMFLFLRDKRINYIDYIRLCIDINRVFVWVEQRLFFLSYYYHCLPHFFFFFFRFSILFTTTWLYTKDLLVYGKANRQYSRLWFANWWEKIEEMKCDTTFIPVVSASSSNDNSNIYINTSFGFFFPKALYFNDQYCNLRLFFFFSFSFSSIKKC